MGNAQSVAPDPALSQPVITDQTVVDEWNRQMRAAVAHWRGVLALPETYGHGPNSLSTSELRNMQASVAAADRVVVFHRLMPGAKKLLTERLELLRPATNRDASAYIAQVVQGVIYNDIAIRHNIHEITKRMMRERLDRLFPQFAMRAVERAPQHYYNTHEREPVSRRDR